MSIQSSRDNPSRPVCDLVRALRLARGETGEQFGRLIGLSKGKVSELEAGKFSCSVAVAIAIEAISGGQIDAASLNADVAAARATAGEAATPPQPEPAARIVLCAACERNLNDPALQGCTAADCPRPRGAATIERQAS